MNMIHIPFEKIILRTFGLLYLLLLSCSVNGNYLGVSRSVSESIQDELLISQYNIEDSYLSMDTLGNLTILEAFVENKWRSNDDLSKSKIPGHQLILKLSDDMPEEYSFKWLFKIENGNRFSNNGKSLLVTDVSKNQIKDTIMIEVFIGDVFYLDTLKVKKKHILLVSQ